MYTDGGEDMLFSSFQPLRAQSHNTVMKVAMLDLSNFTDAGHAFRIVRTSNA